MLNECNYGILRSKKIDLAVLPWGATEPHNYHLPFGTDTLETMFIAEMAAEKAANSGAKVMVLPSIPLGMQNPGQTVIPFCLSAGIETQLSILRDIVQSLKGQKLKKLLVLNGHGGNDFKPMIRNLYSDIDDFFIGLVNWYEIIDTSFYFDEPGDHAGEMETSIMMYAFPDLVSDIGIAGSGESRKFKLDCLNNKEVWTPRDWSRVSKDTGIGSPVAASAEKGESFVADLSDKLADIFIEIAGADINSLYQ